MSALSQAAASSDVKVPPMLWLVAWLKRMIRRRGLGRSEWSVPEWREVLRERERVEGEWEMRRRRAARLFRISWVVAFSRGACGTAVAASDDPVAQHCSPTKHWNWWKGIHWDRSLCLATPGNLSFHKQSQSPLRSTHNLSNQAILEFYLREQRPETKGSFAVSGRPAGHRVKPPGSAPVQTALLLFPQWRCVNRRGTLRRSVMWKVCWQHQARIRWNTLPPYLSVLIV